MNNSHTSAPIYQGYFGKMPTHGDFVHNNLPRSFITPWDTWLQSAIATSQQQIGEDWLNHFIISPPYHYVLSPGVCGEQIWMGVMIPSVDAVGRYYPLTLCRSLDSANTSATNPLVLFERHKKWFVGAETLLRKCLIEDLQAHQLEEKSRHLVINESQPSTRYGLQQHPNIAWRIESGGAASDSVEQTQLFSAVLDKFCIAYSLWKTEGSAHVPSSLLLAQGFPPFESISAMLDGRWNAYGWKDEKSG